MARPKTSSQLESDGSFSNFKQARIKGVSVGTFSAARAEESRIAATVAVTNVARKNFDVTSWRMLAIPNPPLQTMFRFRHNQFWKIRGAK